MNFEKKKKKLLVKTENYTDNCFKYLSQCSWFFRLKTLLYFDQNICI